MNIKRSGAMKFLEGLMGGPLTLGGTIQAVRTCDEVSQADLAKRVGLSRQYLCDIEKGRRSVSPELAVRLARALGYPQALFVRLALQDQLNAAGIRMTVSVEPTKDPAKRSRSSGRRAASTASVATGTPSQRDTSEYRTNPGTPRSIRSAHYAATVA